MPRTYIRLADNLVPVGFSVEPAPPRSKRGWTPLWALVVGMLLLVVWPAPAGAKEASFVAGFSDVPAGHPYAAAIDDLAGWGIVVGDDASHFGPDDPVTRQQFAKMVILTLGLTVTEHDSSSFEDVSHDPGTLYPYHFVSVAAANGITVGYDDGTFRPADRITRAQVLSMVIRAGGFGLADPPDDWTGVLAYSNPWHGENIRKAEFNGVCTAITDLRHWNTDADVTRGEVAQILHNLLAHLGTAPRLNALTSGAAGDGVTDDTESIQHAIDVSAAHGMELYLPATPAGYLVTDTLRLRSGTTLTGERSVLFMPSASSYQQILFVPENGDGSNIEVRGLVFRSTNDRRREAGGSGLGSNVMGIQLSNYRNVTIEDVAFENMEYGLKADTAGSQLRLVRARSSGTPAPLYVSHCSGGYFSDLDFDRSNTPPGTLWHHVYVNGGCSDLTFERLRLTGGESWAFQICPSDPGPYPARAITVRDVTLQDVGSGLVVTEGTSQVSFSGIKGSGIAPGGCWFGVQNEEGAGVTDVVFEDFAVKGGSALFEVWASAQHRVGNVRIANGRIDGETTANTLELENIDYVALENVRFVNATARHDGTSTLFAGRSSSYGRLLVEGCEFSYVHADTAPISLSAAGTAEFRGNTFTVEPGSGAYVNDNMFAGRVDWAPDNVVEGFAGIRHPGDTRTVLN